eukprot:2125082-Rhodomonas_salina.2
MRLPGAWRDSDRAKLYSERSALFSARFAPIYGCTADILARFAPIYDCELRLCVAAKLMFLRGLLLFMTATPTVMAASPACTAARLRLTHLVPGTWSESCMA